LRKLLHIELLVFFKIVEAGLHDIYLLALGNVELCRLSFGNKLLTHA
jgi:hypothetical protein